VERRGGDEKGDEERKDGKEVVWGEEMRWGEKYAVRRCEASCVEVRVMRLIATQ
jgi:hypothetical protein